MSSPNRKLQQRREATPSPVVAGQPMSRAELAEAVNDYLWRVDGQRSDLDAHAIARYERGAVRWPGAHYRRAMCAVLHATERELGFTARRHRADLERDALSVNVLSPFDPDAALLATNARSTSAIRVGWEDIHNIRSITRSIASMENAHGGGSAAEVAATQLAAVTPLLGGRVAPAARHALFEAVGNLSGIAAYCAFDIGAHATAERHLRFALWCADSAGSWNLRAATLADMARRSAYLGNDDGALSLIELAQVRSDRLTYTTRAMLSTMRAQFLSRLDRFDEASSEVARADEHFMQREPERDPPWMCYYDLAEHLGSAGKALIPVAMACNDAEPAESRIREAIRLYGEQYPRSRVFSRIRLATLIMWIGDPRHATMTGMMAVEEGARFRSRRVRDELRGMADAATRHRRIPTVGALLDTLEHVTKAEMRP
ncbi:XRE family transcriptional regulator [Nocardia higoensis]|uniref:XRE family transcriptional regulator n=1 Tax=Nocardia higoensis TaxID=228599 RepID=A0ABS0DAQ7_9NOCA|nr:XRE family transcriptional regulator [Nocardia higoensis]MBF6355546.1 XRE family transcriptional regulator [Nocardia higoensis]